MKSPKDMQELAVQVSFYAQRLAITEAARTLLKTAIEMNRRIPEDPESEMLRMAIDKISEVRLRDLEAINNLHSKTETINVEIPK